MGEGEGVGWTREEGRGTGNGKWHWLSMSACIAACRYAVFAWSMELVERCIDAVLCMPHPCTYRIGGSRRPLDAPRSA